MGERTKTVMVAEDEFLIRMLAVSILTGAGFNVVEAHHGDHALSLLQLQAHGIHALLTDIQMPGSMDGLALAHHVRGAWPWIALLIVSGAVVPDETELPEGSRFLAKPYDPDHVVAHLRSLTGH